jgi:hypothetical protein
LNPVARALVAEKGLAYYPWQAKPPTPPRTINGLQALVG